MRTIIFFTAAFFGLTGLLSAHQLSGSVYITSQDTVLKPEENCGHPQWKKEQKEQAILASTGKFEASPEWTKLTFSFVPEKDGVINLALIGGGNCKTDYFQKKPNQCYIAWDKLELTGAELLNGSFETLDARMGAEHWQSLLRPEQSADGKALDGKYIFPMGEEKQARQTGIRVRAGEKVTFTGYCRFLKCVQVANE